MRAVLQSLHQGQCRPLSLQSRPVHGSRRVTLPLELPMERAERHAWLCADSMEHVFICSSQRAGRRPAFLELSGSHFALNSLFSQWPRMFGKGESRIFLRALGWKYIEIMAKVQQESRVLGGAPLYASVKSEPRTGRVLAGGTFPSARHN